MKKSVLAIIILLVAALAFTIIHEFNGDIPPTPSRRIRTPGTLDEWMTDEEIKDEVNRIRPTVPEKRLVPVQYLAPNGEWL